MGILILFKALLFDPVSLLQTDSATEEPISNTTMPPTVKRTGKDSNPKSKPKPAHPSPESTILRALRNENQALQAFIRRTMPHLLTEGEVVLYSICDKHPYCKVVSSTVMTVELCTLCHCTEKPRVQKVQISGVKPMRVLSENEYHDLLNTNEFLPPGAANTMTCKDKISKLRATRLRGMGEKEHWKRVFHYISLHED